MLEALAAGRAVHRILIRRGTRGRVTDVRDRAAAAGVRVVYVDGAELDALSFGGNHQGVAAELAVAPPARLTDLLQPDAGRACPPLLLAADQVQDVGNLGSLIRTLEAVGGAGLILPARRSARVSGGLARASSGASLRIPIVEAGNLARALDELRQQQVRIIGLDAAAVRAFDTVDLRPACCLVVGNEARGLRPAVRAACDDLVAVPMRGHMVSLNVAVAGAIVLYHVGRSRDTEPSLGA